MREEARSTNRISLESSYNFIRKHHFYYRIENHYFMILSFCILRWVDIQCGQQASSQINCRSLQAVAVECSKLPLQWEEFQESLDVFGNDKEKLLQSRDRSPSEFKDWRQGKIGTQYSWSQKTKPNQPNNQKPKERNGSFKICKITLDGYLAYYDLTGLQ